MSDLSMLINGLKVTAERNATFERRNPLDGTVATRAPACSPADAVMAVEAAAEAFRTWSETGPNERRMLLLKAADALEAKTPAVHRSRAGRDRRHRHVGRLQRHAGGGHDPRGRVADHAGGRRGDPLRRARQPGDGPARAGRRGAGHRAVERAGHPGRARHRHAAGLRQHRHPEGQRELPAHPCADHRGLCRRRLPAGRRQLHHQCAGRCRCGGGGDGRAPRGAARQLHRHHARSAGSSR